MTAKKTTTRRGAADKTTKSRRPKAAQAEKLPDEILPPVQPAVAQAAETPAEPAAEAAMIVRPTVAEAAMTATTERPPANKLSALDAAAKVLGESGQAMNCQEVVAAMAVKGYWSSPKRRTPASTLYAAILREMQRPRGRLRCGPRARPGVSGTAILRHRRLVNACCGDFRPWASVEGSVDTDQAVGSSQKQCLHAFQNFGRSVSAPRARTRTYAGVSGRSALRTLV